MDKYLRNLYDNVAGGARTPNRNFVVPNPKNQFAHQVNRAANAMADIMTNPYNYVGQKPAKVVKNPVNRVAKELESALNNPKNYGKKVTKVTKKSANPQAIKDGLDAIYGDVKNFKTEVAKNAVNAAKVAKANPSLAANVGRGMKTFFKYAPLTGDVYDIYHGVQRLQNEGNPWVGAGEIGLGALGLATLGTGSLAKSAVKAGTKTLLNAGVKKGVLRAAAKPVKFMAAHPIVANAVPSTVLYYIPDNYTQGITPQQAQVIDAELQKANEAQPPMEPLAGDPGDQETQPTSPVQQVASPGYRQASYPQNGGSVGDYIRANQSYNNYQDDGQGYDLNSVPLHQTATPYAQGQNYQDLVNGMGVQTPPAGGSLEIGGVSGGAAKVDSKKVQALLDQYQQELQAQNQPYTDALQNYLNNYDRYIQEGMRNKRYWTGYANLHSSPEVFSQAMGKAMEDYDPVELEAKRVDLIKALADQNATIPTAMRQMKGNMALSSQLGIPPEAMMADPSLLKTTAAYNKAYNALIGDIYKADKSLEGKIYTGNIGYRKGVDVANINAGSRNYLGELAYNAKLYEAQLNATIDWAIQNNKADLARELMAQKLKLGGLQSAIGSAPFMNDPSQLQPYLDALGIKVNYNQPAAGLTEQGLAQPATITPATPSVTPQRVPAGMTPAQALYYSNRGR